MSKIKEQLLREQDNLLEYYSGFMKWLDRYQQEPKLSDLDINKMKENFTEQSITFNRKEKGYED